MPRHRHGTAARGNDLAQSTVYWGMYHWLATVVSAGFALVGVAAAFFGIRNLVRRKSTLEGLQEEYRPEANGSMAMSFVMCLWVTVAFLLAAVMLERDFVVSLALAGSPLILGLALIPISQRLLAEHPSDPELRKQVSERMQRFLPKD